MKILKFIDHKWIEEKASKKTSIKKSIRNFFNVLYRSRNSSFLFFVYNVFSSNNFFNYNISIFIAKFSSYFKLPLFTKYFSYLKSAKFLSNKKYPTYIEEKFPQIYIFDNPKKTL